MKRIFACAAVAAAAVATSPAAAAAASPAAAASEKVSYADIDLSTSAGRGELDRRISAAASRLCLQDAQASPAPGYIDRKCYGTAMAGAQAQVDRAVASGQALTLVASARH